MAKVARFTTASVIAGVLAAAAAGSASADSGVDLLHAVPAIVAVSSTVDNATILPEHLVDGKLDTAWNSRTGDLVGAWIAVRLPNDVHVSAIRMTVGFTKKDPKYGDLFTMNPRITKVRVTHDKTVVDKTLDPELRTLQAIAIDGGGGDYRIEITEIAAGSKAAWKEINVSELQVVGTARGAPTSGAKPVVRVGGFTQPALAKDDCVHALLPADSSDTIGTFETVELADALALCRVDHLAAYSEPVMNGGDVHKGAAEIAIVRRSPRVAVVARKSWPVVTAVPSNGMAPVAETSVAITPIQLTTSEVALLVEQTDGTASDGTTASTLYRVGASGFAPVLDFASSWSGTETSTTSRCALAPVAAVDALPALDVVCRTAHEGYRGDHSDHDSSSTSTTHYHWAATRYRK